jgi:hypothetical protein
VRGDCSFCCYWWIVGHHYFFSYKREKKLKHCIALYYCFNYDIFARIKTAEQNALLCFIAEVIHFFFDSFILKLHSVINDGVLSK